MRKNLVLLGMMGVGKTTLGKIVAKKIGLKFIDTDENIEKKCVMKISEIFEKYSFFPDPGIYPDVLNSQLTDRIIQRFLKGDYNDKNNAINPKEKFNLHKFSLFNLVDCRIPKDWYDQYNL